MSGKQNHYDRHGNNSKQSEETTQVDSQTRYLQERKIQEERQKEIQRKKLKENQHMEEQAQQIRMVPKWLTIEQQASGCSDDQSQEECHSRGLDQEQLD